MKTLLRFAAVFSLMFVAVFGAASQVWAQNVSDDEAYANVVRCSDEWCTDVLPEGFAGAVITSFDAAGNEIDRCAVEVFASGMNGCVITKHDGSGWYEVSNLPVTFVLLDDEPEVLESISHGTQLVWYAAAGPEDTVIEDPVEPGDGAESMPAVGVGAAMGAQVNALSGAVAGVVLLGAAAVGVRMSRGE